MEQTNTERRVSYDVFGTYKQDEINGFDQEFIFDFIRRCQIGENDKVLDAMAGDGNLSEKISFLHPEVVLTTTDISSVQCSFAEKKLGKKSRVICADLLEDKLFNEEFDVIVIKSGSHEISLAKQKTLFSQLFKALKPGGRLINLGILFDEAACRDEVFTLNEYRSKLAGIEEDIQNRHFLLRDEFYSILKEVGFDPIQSLKNFHYHIDMGILSREYFANSLEKRVMMNGIVVELKNLRRKHLAVLEENFVVRMPGELTEMRKPIYN